MKVADSPVQKRSDVNHEEDGHDVKVNSPQKPLLVDVLHLQSRMIR